MNISLRQLLIFEALVKTKGYTRAASMLHMTQPAVSMQVKQIQDSVGKPLFERQGKNIVLTEAGRGLHEYSSQVLDKYQEMEDKINEIKNDVALVKISAATTANHFVSHMLASFSEQEKSIQFSLSVNNREDLVQKLHNYEPDLVIMGEPPSGMGLSSVPIMENPLVVIASAKHPLVGRKLVSLQELSTMQFISREQGSGTKAAIERFFTDHDYSLDNTLEMSSNEAIKHSVMAGLGLGIVSLHTIKLELETNNLQMIKAEGFPIMRKWHIVKRKGKELSSAAKKFQDFVKVESDKYHNGYCNIYPI